MADVAKTAADQLAAKAAEAQKKADAKKDKPLPAMASPTVNLLEELRGLEAAWCRESGISITTEVNLMLIDKFEKANKLTKQKAEELRTAAKTKKVGGGGAAIKAKIEAKDTEIAELRKQLDALKAAKK